MTIDSNIIIAYLAGDLEVKNALSDWQLRGLPLFLSTVVETTYTPLVTRNLRDFKKIPNLKILKI